MLTSLAENPNYTIEEDNYTDESVFRQFWMRDKVKRKIKNLQDNLDKAKES